jgi:hypothetical protein
VYGELFAGYPFACVFYNVETYCAVSLINPDTRLVRERLWKGIDVDRLLAEAGG